MTKESDFQGSPRQECGPHVSVIVPVYNCETYLEECARSILEQTYKSLELLLVDDGSTDSSPDLCDQLVKGDPRVRVTHTPNSGVSAARNTGTSCARGNFILFVDADDSLAPCAVDILVRNQEKTSADCVRYGYCEVVAGVSYPVRSVIPEGIYSDPESLGRLKYFFASAREPGYVYLLFLRRSIAERLSFATTIFQREDLVYTLELLGLQPRTSVISDHLYFYRRHEGSTTARYLDPDRALKYIESHFASAERIVVESERISGLDSRRLSKVRTHELFHFLGHFGLLAVQTGLGHRDFVTLAGKFSRDYDASPLKSAGFFGMLAIVVLKHPTLTWIGLRPLRLLASVRTYIRRGKRDTSKGCAMRVEDTWTK